MACSLSLSFCFSLSLSVSAYRTALKHLRVGNHHKVPNEPQRIVSRKRAEEMHVQRDAGALKRSANAKNIKDIYGIQSKFSLSLAMKISAL